jgi:hypothetical protein
VPGDFDEGEILVGEDMAAVLIGNGLGESKHRIALVDMRKGRVEKLVEIGNRSARRKAALKTLRDGLLPMPPMRSRLGDNTSDMAASSDGKSLYALDRWSNEVTVVQLPDGAVTGHLPVNGSPQTIWMAKGSRRLFCIGPNSIEAIDTGDKGSTHEFPLKSGRILHVNAPDDSPIPTIAMEKATLAWDGLTGMPIGGKNPGTKGE